MTRIISTVLLILAGLTAVVPCAAAGQFKKPVYYKVGAVPHSIVTADFDHDGNLDLAVGDPGSGQISILRGKGNGAFHSARNFSVPGCAGLAVGDFNGDHIPDLAVVENAGSGIGTLGIYLGNGDGSFHNSANYQLGPGSVWAAVADFNGDGHDDVAVTNFGSDQSGKDGSVMVLFGKGDGTFGKPATYRLPGGPYRIAAGDLNGDHHPDLVVAKGDVDSVSILMNTGHGKFRKTANYPAGYPHGVAIADLDHNGTPDLAVACSQGIAVLLGNGDGTFGNATIYSTNKVGAAPWNAVVADFNRDGNRDIAAVLAQGNSALLYGNGDGTFKAPVPINIKTGGGYSLATGDFNKDGSPDLAIIVSTVNKIVVLVNAQ